MSWLLVMFLAFPAYAGQPVPIRTESSKPKKQEKTIGQFIQEALKNGEDKLFPTGIGKFLGLTKDSNTKSFRITREQTADDCNHVFDVLVNDSSDTPSAVGLILSTRHVWKDNTESYIYKSTLEGKLEKVIYAPGKNDAAGKPVKGSGTAVEKDIDSQEIKDRFQHELDFWLKGSYRKRTPATKQ